MEKIKILFVFGPNNVRRQMGEAFLNKLAEDRVEPESVGSEPTAVNPLICEDHAGIRIRSQKTFMASSEK